MKFIAKELVEDYANKYDPKGILLLVASHGNVCNVMKEVGVQSAYGALTNQTQAIFQSQTFEDRVLNILAEFREMCVEELYSTFGATNNTHSITLMRNHLAPFIGVETIYDTQASNWGLPQNWQHGLEGKYWGNHYNVPKITNFVRNAMNEEPRKISYEVLTKFLEEHKPIEDTYLFYTDVYDMESGKIKPRYVQWILHRLDIFRGPKITFKIPEKIPEVIDGEPGSMEVNERVADYDGPSELVDSAMFDYKDVQVRTHKNGEDLKQKYSSAIIDVSDIPTPEEIEKKRTDQLVKRWHSQYEMYLDDPVIQA